MKGVQRCHLCIGSLWHKFIKGPWLRVFNPFFSTIFEPFFITIFLRILTRWGSDRERVIYPCYRRLFQIQDSCSLLPNIDQCSLFPDFLGLCPLSPMCPGAYFPLALMTSGCFGPVFPVPSNSESLFLVPKFRPNIPCSLEHLSKMRGAAKKL